MIARNKVNQNVKHKSSDLIFIKSSQSARSPNVKARIGQHLKKKWEFLFFLTETALSLYFNCKLFLTHHQSYPQKAWQHLDKLYQLLL